MTDKIQVRVISTKNDLITKYMLSMIYGFNNQLWALIFLIIYIFCTTALSILGYSETEIFLIVFPFIFWLIYFVIKPMLIAKEFVKNPTQDDEYHWIFSQNDVCLKSNGQNEDIGWDKFTDLIENKNSFLLEKQGRKGNPDYVFIPKRCFESKVVIEKFRTLVKVKVAAQKRTFFFRHRRMILWVGVSVLIGGISFVAQEVASVIK